jgi:hypothetical protein
MSYINHPLLTAVKPLVDACGGTFVGADKMQSGDIPLVWEGSTIAAVRMQQ